MTTNSSTVRHRSGAYWYFILISLALLVLPLILGTRMLVSPILIFGVACISTVVNHAIGGDGVRSESQLYSRVFYLRLTVSIAAAFLLLAIDYVARSFSL